MQKAPFSRSYFGVSVRDGHVCTHGLWRRQAIGGFLGLIFLIVGFLGATGDVREPRMKYFGWTSWAISAPFLLYLGVRDECEIDLHSGEVKRKRGFLIFTGSLTYASPQIDGVRREIRQAQDNHGGTTTYGRVELGAGLATMRVFEGNVDQAYDFAASLCQTLGWQMLDSDD